MAGKLSHFLESNNMPPPSQLLYRRSLGTCDSLLSLSHRLQVSLIKLVQLDFSAAFDTVSHCGLLHKLRSISVGGQLVSMVSEFPSVRLQRVRWDGKVNASIDVVSEWPRVAF